MENKSPLIGQKKEFNRRNFLKLAGLASLGLASTVALPLGAEAVKFNRKLYKVSKTRLDIGTFVSMTLIHPSRDEAEEAMEVAFGEIARLTGLLNRYSNNTAVGLLNQEGSLSDVPPEVRDVIRASMQYYRLTNGAFDITVKPIVDLFQKKFASGANIPPSEQELERALELVGANYLVFDNRTIRFNKHGMGITLDGIAKGYIVDRASQILTERGIKNHLINAGGDIRTKGYGKGHKPWTIAIQDPMKKRHYPDIIHMNDGAIATSGNYEVYFDNEKMFHHIVNPKTGHSPIYSTSVSVRAKTTMEADALSTSVFVMNPVEGTKFINSLPACECFIVTRRNGILKSAGWKSRAI